MSPVRRLSPFWIVLGVIAAGYLGFWFAMLAATATYTSPREVMEVLLSREIRKRWRMATPRTTWPERCWSKDGIVLAGDAFGGPRIEGAVLSGLAAAQRVLDY